MAQDNEKELQQLKNRFHDLADRSFSQGVFTFTGFLGLSEQDIFWKEAQASDHLSYTIPASKPIKLDLQISGRDNSNKWNAHSSVSNKYTKTDVNKLFSSMMAQ